MPQGSIPVGHRPARRRLEGRDQAILRVQESVEEVADHHPGQEVREEHQGLVSLCHKLLRHVTIPNLRGMIAILFILNIGKIFNADFGLFYNVPMQNGALFPVTQVVDTYIYYAMLNTGNIGMTSAAGLLQNVIGLFCILGANRVIKRIDSESALF